MYAWCACLLFWRRGKTCARCRRSCCLAATPSIRCLSSPAVPAHTYMHSITQLFEVTNYIRLYACSPSPCSRAAPCPVSAESWPPTRCSASPPPKPSPLAAKPHTYVHVCMHTYTKTYKTQQYRSHQIVRGAVCRNPVVRLASIVRPKHSHIYIYIYTYIHTSCSVQKFVQAQPGWR